MHKLSIRLLILTAVIFTVVSTVYLVSLNISKDRLTIFDRLETRHGIFVVAGYSGIFGGWDISLYWKRPNQPWAQFYLDSDAVRWSSVRLSEHNGFIEIRHNAPPEYNVDTSQLIIRRLDGETWDLPLRLFQDDPFTEGGGGETINRFHPAWKNAWPYMDKELASKIWESNTVRPNPR